MATKLMWTPGHDVFWDVATEESLTDRFSPRLTEESLALTMRWAEQYESAYHRWLEEDDAMVFDLSSQLMEAAVNLVSRISSETGVRCYLWYDRDRSLKEEDPWQHCPLCNRKLTDNCTWFRANRFTCEVCRLVLPDSEEALFGP